MNSREILKQHATTLEALLRGGIRRGVGGSEDDEDDLLGSMHSNWATQRRLIQRVLREPGDPLDRLMEMRERTEGFIDSYPEREGWTDAQGESWEAQRVLEAIDKLLEEVEARQAEMEDFEEEEYDEDDF